MKTRALGLMALAVCLALAAPAAAEWTVTQVTDNTVNELYPQVSGSNIVWNAFVGSDLEVFFHEGRTGTTTQLTDNDRTDYQPVISGSNVAWRDVPAGGLGSICVWDGTSTTTYSHASISYQDPQISGDHVVWRGWDSGQGDIFYTDGGSVQRATYTSGIEGAPRISGARAVWTATASGGSGQNVYLYDGATVTELGNGTVYGDPDISADYVVWSAVDPVNGDGDIYGYDGATTAQFNFEFGAQPNHLSPRVSGEKGVWFGWSDDSYALVWGRGLGSYFVTDGLTGTEDPQVSGEYVVWSEFDGNDTEIFAWDWQTRTVVQLTDNDYTDSDPHISGSTIVWSGIGLDGGTDREIMMAVNLDGTTEYLTYGEDQESQLNGGSDEIGGIDALFDEITGEGEFSGQFDPTPLDELDPEVFEDITFFMPTDPVMMWDIQFTGEFIGQVELTFCYDDSALLPGFDEADLWVWHTLEGPPVSWEMLTVTDRDLDANTITVLTTGFSEFAIGSPVPEPATMSLLALGGLALLKRKRRGDNPKETER